MESIIMIDYINNTNKKIAFKIQKQRKTFGKEICMTFKKTIINFSDNVFNNIHDMAVYLMLNPDLKRFFYENSY